MGNFFSDHYKDSNDSIIKNKLIIPQKQFSNKYNYNASDLDSLSMLSTLDFLETLKTMNIDLDKSSIKPVYSISCVNNKCEETVNKPLNIQNTDSNNSTSPFVYDKSLIKDNNYVDCLHHYRCICNILLCCLGLCP